MDEELASGGELVGFAEHRRSFQSLGIWVARKPLFLARILHRVSLLFKCIIIFHIIMGEAGDQGGWGVL